jgi:hypothetical protein
MIHAVTLQVLPGEVGHAGGQRHDEQLHRGGCLVRPPHLHVGMHRLSGTTDIELVSAAYRAPEAKSSDSAINVLRMSVPLRTTIADTTASSSAMGPIKSRSHELCERKLINADYVGITVKAQVPRRANNGEILRIGDAVFSQLAPVRSGRFRGSARSLPYRDAA